MNTMGIEPKGSLEVSVNCCSRLCSRISNDLYEANDISSKTKRRVFLQFSMSDSLIIDRSLSLASLWIVSPLIPVAAAPVKAVIRITPVSKTCSVI